ncbi:hypothetical protein O7626_15220 [Micromonospora sp. WMMD1102]|uniref:hypothetical protein n=1 Tax=Micromonospora sp. WMMD1102 TaxID=3016105 RepID=UPI002414E7C6|nr:hypothetical protein [Micromonospora sp. WMMD1102]MDG4787265.1 hypothetical protein [Micromonospora sp. WMMD1102]
MQPPVVGDLRLRVTVVPPKIDDGRDWLLLRGYVLDADGVEAVRDTWHYVRPERCQIRPRNADHGG